MCWIVKTRFLAGIWLHDPANDHRGYIQSALSIKVDRYTDALKMLKEEAEIRIEGDKFQPNKLFKIHDDKIFVVFYNKRYAGFAEMSETDNFMQRHKMGWNFYRKRWRLTYQQAVAMVTSLGAITGEDKIWRRKNPVCGRLYRRNSE